MLNITYFLLVILIIITSFNFILLSGYRTLEKDLTEILIKYEDLLIENQELKSLLEKKIENT